ncbi:MAG: hypothetical protein JRI80_00035 [Deltaproteobacteria bacterium]|nr:hypothetical protein [Deltaproteobacteria bacterium]
MTRWTAYSHRHRIGKCGLRDYGVEGQIGLEPTLAEFIDKMLAVTKELKRVLKPTGTLWWNHGDNYCSGTAHVDWKGHEQWYAGNKDMEGHRFNRKYEKPAPAKCLAFQNYRLVLAMMDDLRKWELRDDLTKEEKQYVVKELILLGIIE